LFINFTSVLASVPKDRKRTWKRGNRQSCDFPNFPKDPFIFRAKARTRFSWNLQ